MNPLDDFIERAGLVRPGEPRTWTALTGGVSSDIWRVALADGRSLCVKRALSKLKVAADWHAPVSRNAYEWAYLRFACEVVPGRVPQPIAHDPQVGMFAMTYLDEAHHPVWKRQLLAGVVHSETAAEVGRTLGRLHQASAGRDEIAAAFDTGENFHALRLEPYLVATAARHPEVAPRLHELVNRTANTRMVLVHGDVSPKNILVGPQGPVLLDAECAWYGDPAFDVAFCLNRLLLKRLPRPECASPLREAFEAFVQAYFSEVRFEPREALERRAAHLLPALFLARIDGKSPVEYIEREEDREAVRATALALLRRPANRLSDIALTWFGPPRPEP